MSEYRVKFYKGDYRERQRNATRDNAVLYVEQHFNGGTANYSCVIIGSNASAKSQTIAENYAQLCAEHFKTRLGGEKGVLRGGYGGRGNANVYYTACPAILLEPLFCGNPHHAEIIKSERGLSILAQILYLVIKAHFPEGGLIAFSVGHKYKTSNPADRGAPITGGGTEAEYAEKVLLKAAELLTAKIKIEPEPIPVLFSEDDNAPEAVVTPSAEAAVQSAIQVQGELLEAKGFEPSQFTAYIPQIDTAKRYFKTLTGLTGFGTIGAFFGGLPQWVVISLFVLLMIVIVGGIVMFIKYHDRIFAYVGNMNTLRATDGVHDPVVSSDTPKN